MLKEERNTQDQNVDLILSALESVKDPEIPVISIKELGILREVYKENDSWVVIITPTYSGCPAMEQIKADVKAALDQNGIFDANVKLSLSPAWTTDWITEEGKEKLRKYGIAPPVRKTSDCMKAVFLERLHADDIVSCPHCNSENTNVVSEFGSTACKALYRCDSCLEPFDYFKPH